MATTKKAADAADKTTSDSAEMQAQVDKEQDQGFRGTKVDPTPNHAYTVGGVTKSEATPETDLDLREQARKRQRGELPGGQTEITAEREPGEGE